MFNAATLQRLVGIALLREGPQDLPASQNLMLLLALATGAINYPAIVHYTPEVQPFLQLGLLLGFNATFVYIALALRNMRPRFVQSMSALFGTDALISAVALPVLFLLGPPGAGEADAGSGIAAIAFLLLLVWNIAVVNHILRQALDLSRFIGLLVTLGYIFGASVFVFMVTGA